MLQLCINFNQALTGPPSEHARVVWHGDRKLQFFDHLGVVLVDGKLKPVTELSAYLACLDINSFNYYALVHFSLVSGDLQQEAVLEGAATGRHMGFHVTITS